MPTPAYIRIEGENQGLITQGALTQDSVGGLWKRGHEDEILIHAFKHKIERPSDPNSGTLTGLAIHGPLNITKVIDKSSPLLYNALVNGETLTTCEIRCFRTNTNGEQEHFFSINLEDAIVVEIESNMPHCQDPNMKNFIHMEEISFRYQKITWSHEISGTTGMHDWQGPQES
ncbi:Type VI secretion system effector, Hcp1 [Candidatus Magnetomorum sp. HK-1]|nr:Type VI secretion system effector, Hcp1 [Candidatus Magnetomorum sp. HK-1]